MLERLHWGEKLFSRITEAIISFEQVLCNPYRLCLSIRAREAGAKISCLMCSD